MGLAVGSEEEGPVDLPRLDVEQGLVFGGGADMGDDFWSTLDLRTSRPDPCVVGNQFRNKAYEWFEITPTFRAFYHLLVL